MFLFVSAGSEVAGELQDEMAVWHSTSSMSLLFCGPPWVSPPIAAQR